MQTLNDPTTTEITSQLFQEFCKVVDVAAVGLLAIPPYIVRIADEEPELLGEARKYFNRAFRLPSLWVAMLAVGRGSASPHVLGCTERDRKQLLALTKTDQEKMLAEGVEVYIGENDHVVRRLDEMSERERQQIIGAARLRSLDEQHVYFDQRQREGDLDKMTAKQRLAAINRILRGATKLTFREKEIKKFL